MNRLEVYYKIFVKNYRMLFEQKSPRDEGVSNHYFSASTLNLFPI